MLERDRHLRPVGRSDGLDALLWFLVWVLLLSILPIGWVSGDGIVQSARYARGDWSWDPNALLLEPVGAWWQTRLTAVGLPRHGVDQLKLLSVLAGALSVGLFRFGFAGRVAQSRFSANHGTAWMALGSAFSRMWISEEAYMLQMPFLVLGAIMVLRFVEHLHWRDAIGAGAFVGLAALFFISNLLLAASIGISLGLFYGFQKQWGPSIRGFFGVAIGSAIAAGTVLLFGWMNFRRGDHGFLTWVASYGGGEQGFRRFAATQGVDDISLRSFVLSTARTLYGGASSIVDLAPVVEVLRDDLPITAATVLNLLAFVAGAAVFALAILWLFRRSGAPRYSAVQLITAAWVAQIFLFMVFWDNSDAQFYFQLAIPLAAIVAVFQWRHSRVSSVLLGLSMAALAWNTVDLFSRFVLYPRTERVAALERQFAGSGLVIYPGRDDVAHMMYFVDRRSVPERLSLTELANKHSPEEGLSLLDSMVREAVTSGRRVDVVAVYDVPSGGQPWKQLRAIGYDHRQILGTLGRYRVDQQSRQVGPWTLRSIPPTASAPDVANPAATSSTQ